MGSFVRFEKEIHGDVDIGSELFVLVLTFYGKIIGIIIVAGDPDFDPGYVLFFNKRIFDLVLHRFGLEIVLSVLKVFDNFVSFLSIQLNDHCVRDSNFFCQAFVVVLILRLVIANNKNSLHGSFNVTKFLSLFQTWEGDIVTNNAAFSFIIV